MTAVHVHLTRPQRGTVDRAPALGTLNVSLYRRQVEGDAFVLVTKFAQVLDADGQATLQLTPTDGTNAWVVEERVPDGQKVRVVSVPDATGTVEYNTLPELTLSTLTPVVDAVPAWTAAAVTATQARDQAYAARDQAQQYAAGSLQKTQNFADVGNAATARTNLGLGTAATQSSTAFDAAGAASAAQSTAAADASTKDAALAASVAATYPALNGGQRLAIGGTQLDPARIGAEVAGAAAAITLGGLGGAKASDLTAEVTRAQNAEALKAPLASPSFSGTVTGISKAMVGLGNVDNTADAAKPVSTAQATALAGKADLVGGLVPTAQIPALALVTSTVVASQAAMLALTPSQVQPGDLAVRTDGAGTFILNNADPSQLTSWTRLNAPTDLVQSINGQQGTVVLGKADLGLSNVDNTADTAKPVSNAQGTAIAQVSLSAGVVTFTAASTLSVNARNALDASTGSFTATLPAPSKIGQLLLAERVDTSTTTTVTIAAAAGATIRGNASATIALPGTGVANESLLFIAESMTSWAVAAGHKPKSWLDVIYQGTLGWATLPTPSGGDDTAAVQAVLNSGAQYVVARPATYKVTALTVPTGVQLIGTVPRTYVGTPTSGTVFQQLGTAAAVVFTLNGGCYLEAIGIVGNGNGTGVKFTAHNAVIFRCTIRNNVIGVDCSYKSVLLIDACNIYSNSGAGIANPVDSSIRDNYINVNSPGLALGTGSNDNTITGNKFEFNSTSGISAYQAEHNIISSNVVDRNGSSGIKLVSCLHSSITGNMLRRNGANQSAGTAGEDCHLHIESSSGIVIGQNTTSTGANDDATGYTSPKYAAYIQANPGNVRVIGNDFSGFTTAAYNLVGSSPDLSTSQNGLGSAEISARTRSALGVIGTTGNVTTNTSTSQTFAGLKLDLYNPGTLYVLDIVARDTSTGSRTAARVAFTVSREGGNATVSTLSITNLVGTAFGSTGTTHTVAVTAAGDGTTVTAAVTNTSANTVQYGLSLS